MRPRFASRLSVSIAVLTTFALLLAESVLAATITNFSPIVGAYVPPDSGAVVTLSGTGFVGATAVAFNGTKATWFEVGSDTTIFTRVPPNATTGPITVTARDGSTASTVGLNLNGMGYGGNATNGSFTVVANAWDAAAAGPNSTKASISSFRPVKAKIETKVTVIGLNLTGATAVKIAGLAARFKVESDGRITVTVPKKAVTGKISVKTSGGWATSSATLKIT